MSYLYTKESKSSFEIEHIKPTATRTERFVSLLQSAEKEDFFRKTALIELQNQIVDERFRDHDYRATQNYVGESVSWQNERVHFVSPKPEDLATLMEGMFAAHAHEFPMICCRKTTQLTNAISASIGSSLRSRRR